jgi:hypothetical protein
LRSISPAVSQEAEAPDLPTEEHVLRDVEAVREREVPVDELDARAAAYADPMVTGC